MNAISDIEARARAKLEYVLKNRVMMKLDVRAAAPVIVIPHQQPSKHGIKLIKLKSLFLNFYLFFYYYYYYFIFIFIYLVVFIYLFYIYYHKRLRYC